MGEHNSPYHAAGLDDGLRDAELAARAPTKECPNPPQPVGMDPTKSWSIMYRKGYASGFPESGVDPYDVQDRPETGWKRAGMSRRKSKSYWGPKSRPRQQKAQLSALITLANGSVSGGN